MTMQYVVYFQFCGDVMFTHVGPYGLWLIAPILYKATHLRAKCDVHDCLVYCVHN